MPTPSIDNFSVKAFDYNSPKNSNVIQFEKFLNIETKIFCLLTPPKSYLYKVDKTIFQVLRLHFQQIFWPLTSHK